MERIRKMGYCPAAAVAVVAGVLLFSACSGNSRPGPKASSPCEKIVVHAAASTTDVLRELCERFEAGTGVSVALAFASSGALGRQITAGAAGDVFISANVVWMDELEHRGLLVPGTRSELARNSLVLIAPAASPFRFDMGAGHTLPESFEGYLAVGDFPSVPAGTYAREALTSLGCFRALSGRFVRGSDVRAVLMYVARGEAEAGIVYATDARRSGEVKVVAAFPSDSHTPIRYPMAMLTNAANPSGATAFLDYLGSAEAQVILMNHGFRPLGGRVDTI